MTEKLSKLTVDAAKEYTKIHWRGKWALEDSMEKAFAAGVGFGIQWCIDTAEEVLKKQNDNTTNTNSTDPKD